MNPQIRIFVINLPRSIARRRETESRLAALGLSWDIVEATDRAEPCGALPSGAPGLSRREASCLESHRSALTRFLDVDRPLGCVLEDDCDLQPPLARVLGALAARPGPPAWDVLLLGHHSARHGPADGVETCFRGTPIIAGYRAARVAEFPMGAYAYVVTPCGARLLLEHGDPPRMPADWVTGYAPASGARLYAVTPPCVLPLASHEAATTIDDRAARSGPAAPPFSADRSLRARAGRAWLFLRKLGIRPDGYVRRF